jgi:hypothetical protein
MTLDRISDPTHHCHKHNQSFYFHCVRCFNPGHAQPVHLRAKPFQNGTGEQTGRQQRRWRKHEPFDQCPASFLNEGCLAAVTQTKARLRYLNNSA